MVCPTPAAQDTTSDPAQRLKGIRVVVVDDEEGPRTLFREVLVLEGAQVTAFERLRHVLDEDGRAAHRTTIA
jgi:DNA-binding NtrC family response regulator